MSKIDEAIEVVEHYAKVGAPLPNLLRVLSAAKDEYDKLDEENARLMSIFNPEPWQPTLPGV